MYSAHGEIALRMDAPKANRLLLAIEMLDQRTPGVDPAFVELREQLRELLRLKSSGDTDSAPSTG
ncbi:MAG TPA: hypothetical protein VIG51_12350 [Candidatus Baltobacteraceae bacterium]|jgi:hypothetical protein